MGVCHGGVWRWIRAMGLIDGDVSWGCVTGSGWWDWSVGARHRGARHWLDQAMGLIHGGMQHRLDRGNGIVSWGHAMGARDTGWIGALGLIHGGLPWGHTTLAGSGQWDWFMAVCGTGCNGLMGLIREGLPWEHATLTGSGGWDRFMGLCHGGVQHGLDGDDGIDLWGCVMGVRDWIGVMALIGGMGLVLGWD